MSTCHMTHHCCLGNFKIRLLDHSVEKSIVEKHLEKTQQDRNVCVVNFTGNAITKKSQRWLIEISTDFLFPIQ